MSTIAQKTRYQIVLDLEVYDDFDPKQIDWHELLKIEGGEELHATIKELDDSNW
jgi:hypothetical protein